jgi:hypothetical protein
MEAEEPLKCYERDMKPRGLMRLIG